VGAFVATKSLAAWQGFFVYRLNQINQRPPSPAAKIAGGFVFINMLKWFLIAVGGAIGSMSRYAMQGWVKQLFAGRIFPVGTMFVNVLGCFVIGTLFAYFRGPHGLRIPEAYQIGLMVGVLGGFTTFSSFGLETLNLANDGEYGLAALNMLLSCGFGLLAVWIGYRLAERWFGV
jgi:fluoride exporter